MLMLIADLVITLKLINSREIFCEIRMEIQGTSCSSSRLACAPIAQQTGYFLDRFMIFLCTNLQF
jgi:hypothetical protein